MWEVEFTDEFFEWFDSLTEDEQDSLAVSVEGLRQAGPNLGRPRADTIKGSRHPNMKELRTQYKGRPIRTFFAFDPRRTAILLIRGDKTGDGRFCDRMIPSLIGCTTPTWPNSCRKGYRKWQEIEAKMAPDRLARVKSRARQDIEEMVLEELRKRAGRTPESVAVGLGIDGKTYAELERSDDMPIGTLQRLVRALGGQLDIFVHLPDREIALSQFGSTKK